MKAEINTELIEDGRHEDEERRDEDRDEQQAQAADTAGPAATRRKVELTYDDYVGLYPAMDWTPEDV